MDDLWHLKACEGMNRNFSHSSPASTPVNQIETLPAPFGHSIAQREVCVIERTIRQESVGANLLNCGLQGPNIKSLRGDIDNSLRALLPGSQHEGRLRYQSVTTTQSPVLSSNPQAYQMTCVNSPWIGSWPGHMSGGNRVSGGTSGLVVDSSANMPGREVTLSMLGREVNLSQYSRMTAEQDCLESSPTRTSGLETSKLIENANDISGQGPYPQWLTEIISSRQRGQNRLSSTFASGSSFPRVDKSSGDGSSVNSSLTAFAPILMREARVVCINYDTGQRIGGELYLTQLGLLGVICSCHGCNMSVAKFTQIKVPYDNQGWNWSEGAVSEWGPTKYKAGLTQGWQKEVDFSDSGKPCGKSRLTQVCDASASPRSAANDPFGQHSASLGLSSNLGEGCLRNSKETFLKSFERFTGSSFEAGSYPSSAEDMGESVRRCRGLPDMLSFRNSSTEFINFINGSQELVAGHAEQQVAVEHQIARGSRSLLKGLDLTSTERRDSLQHEKDNSLSSFELKLGQPSQQSQPVGPPVSTAANQMPRVLQRDFSTGQKNIQNSSATTAAGLHIFSGFEEPSSNRLFNPAGFENTAYMEPNLHSFCGVHPNRDMEGNGSVVVDPTSLKETEDVATLRFVENIGEREDRLNRSADQCSPGMRRWSTVGCMRSSFKLSNGLGMNSEHPAKRWADETQLQVGGAARPITQGLQDLDTVLGQEWMSKSRPSESPATESSGTTAGRGGQECCRESMIHIQRDCTPPDKEVCSDDKEQFSCGDTITSRNIMEGHGCKYLNTAKASTSMTKGRILSKVGEDEDVCMKEADSQVEADRQRRNIGASEGPVPQDSISPRGCRLRCFQDVTSQARACGTNSVSEHSNQGDKANSLGGNAHSPIFAAGTDVGIDMKLLNQEGSVAKSGSRESNLETFQWKEMGGNSFPGKDPILDGTHDDMSSPRSLAEDLLADTVANVNSGVPVSSKVSDKLQAVPEICSKSSENGMSEFSDDVGAEIYVSNAHFDRTPVGSRMGYEASKIGNCSSSPGVEIFLTPSIQMSAKGHHSPNQGSPSSQAYSSLCNGTEGSRTRVKTRSRGGDAVMGLPAKHIVEGGLVDTGKVEKKRRKTMKWKRLDGAVGTSDSKRQKLSPSVNMAENFDASQILMQGSDTSDCLRHKRKLGLSPLPCGEDSVIPADSVTVTQGNLAARNSQKGMEVNVKSTDSLHADERHLTTRETLVIRVPQSLDRRTAKRSGRSKPSNMRMSVAAQDDMACNKPALSEMITGDPSPADDSIIKEPPGTRGFIPELAVSAINSLPRHCSTLHTQSGKTGRVIIRRPSPRNTTRMVSLNDIMNRPGSVINTAPKDHMKASVDDGWNFAFHQDGCKASGSKAHPKSCAFKNVMKASALKDGLGAFSCKDSVQISAVEEGWKSLTPSRMKVSGPKKALKMPAMEELKVKSSSSKDGFKCSSSSGGLKGCPAKDGLKVSLAKQVPKIRSSKDGLKAFPGKDDSKALTSDVGFKAVCPKRGLLVSGPVASAQKDNLKEPSPKGVVSIPVTTDCFEVAAVRACSRAAATTKRLNIPVTKIGTHSPADDYLELASRKEVWEASGPKHGVKAAALRLKTLASSDAFQDSFTFAVDVGSVPRDLSNASVFKDASKSFVPMDSAEASSNAKTEGKGSRKRVSCLAMTAVSHDDHDKLSSQVGNSWTMSKHLTRSRRPEVRKVRSLYELISEKTLPGTNPGVVEFHDDDVESSGILKEDSVSRPIVQLDPTFPIPVHLTETKRHVSRGEGSPRGRHARTKNPFLHRHKAGSRDGGKLQAEPVLDVEPVEITGDRRSDQDMTLNVSTPMTSEKELFTDARLRPVTPRMWSAQKNKTKCEINDGTLSSAPVASSLVRVKELLGKGLLDYKRDLSHKRNVEGEITGNALKRQKVLEPSRPSQFNSGLLKARHPLPLSRPMTPSTPSIDAIDSKVKDIEMGPLAIRDDLNIPRRKKSSQRQRWFDCQVPKGVVECCVCGSSISEFFNQIVCCSRCPVKVHQACYGVKKIPNSAWCCRTCKASATHPICVLCGYGGGAMARAQKAVGFLKGLVKVWQEKMNSKERADIGSPHSEEFLEIGMVVDHSLADRQHFLEKHELSSCPVRGKGTREPSEFDSSYRGCMQRLGKVLSTENLISGNTVSSGLLDSTVVQWVHMVCALWMPGTRCLNFGTMGVFDVSGVSQARRKLVCSICNRKGGACMQCRVVKCGIPFHAWCAHEKGLLQSEIVEDGSDQVGFYGKCFRHGEGGDLLNENPDVRDVLPEEPGLINGARSSCARTEGYAGKLTLEERALQRRQASRNGSAAVSPEQVAAWLRINERKTCKARRLLKSANSDQKTDHREYLRFIQEQGWRRLSVYKSGIHALGLYTAEFIGRGAMVVEYIGEIVGLRVADKREADYHSGKRMQYQGACYLFRIDRERIIDATRKGGIARFVNHSCSPNCVAKVICIKNQSKVVFFAQRDIYAGEEITYDYQFNFEQEGDKIPCFCGSANCRGTLN